MNHLPQIEFVSNDVSEVERNVITTYEAISGRKLAPGDPVRLFLQAVSAIIAQQRFLIDYAAKQNLLAYAEGGFLDHLGALVGVSRKEAQPAETILEFTLSAPQVQDVVIPAATRVTPDGKLYFATTQDTTVPAGTISAQANAHCTTPGTNGNGWQPGQINKLVDPLPWIDKVENTTVSSGGTDTEADDEYRERIRLEPEKFSCAGPSEGYKYWAKTADDSIIDVAVMSPAAGQVEIRPLVDTGIPDQTILDAVNSVCNDTEVRPLTDQVTVVAPTAVSYDIDLIYYIATENASVAASIQAAVEDAVDQYVIWQRARLGRDINPSELIARVMKAGAKRVDICLPVYTQVQPTEVAIANIVSVTFGGLEDD